VIAWSASALTCRTRFSAWMASCVASIARLIAATTLSGSLSAAPNVSWSMMKPVGRELVVEERLHLVEEDGLLAAVDFIDRAL
jgi:hypothetical protein